MDGFLNWTAASFRYLVYGMKTKTIGVFFHYLQKTLLFSSISQFSWTIHHMNISNLRRSIMIVTMQILSYALHTMQTYTWARNIHIQNLDANDWVVRDALRRTDKMYTVLCTVCRECQLCLLPLIKWNILIYVSININLWFV